jgi:ADP-ribose pyrophosphatase YjhB (NUDIX family)
MRSFVYCPLHGATLEKPNDDGGARCPIDGRMWYRNPAPTAGAAIIIDGKALVTRRGVDPEKGKFDVPGGFLKPGEEPLDGLKREIAEELGIEIEVSVEDCVQMTSHRYGPAGDYVLALGFLARLVSGEPRAADDVDEIAIVDENELENLDFAWEHDKRLVRRALQAGGERR